MLEIESSLITAIREGRDEAEQTRQLSPSVVRAINEGQLNTMAVAPAYGGIGATLSDMARVLETIAYEDVAVSWVVWNATLVGLYTRFMSEPLRAALFQAGNGLYCQSTIPAGELNLAADHTSLSGRWPLMSGCSNADWAVFTCRVKKDGDSVFDAEGMPVTRLAVVPRSDFEILDTWHTNSLRGTGSHDVVVSSSAVPDDRVFSFEGAPERNSPSDYLPIFASVSALYAAQLLGLGRAVYDASFKRVQSSKQTGPMPPLYEREEIQLAVARHGAGLQACASLLQAAMTKIDSRTMNSVEPDRQEVADLYAASMFVMDTVQRSTRQWGKLAGSSALYVDSPIEKRTRDLDAMSRHIVAQSTFQANTGRLNLGLEPSWSLFLV